MTNIAKVKSFQFFKTGPFLRSNIASVLHILFLLYTKQTGQERPIFRKEG